MTDPTLAGMTREQAEALVDEIDKWSAHDERTSDIVLGCDDNEFAALLALARLGASVIGATEATVVVGDLEPDPPRDPSWEDWQGLKRRVLVLPDLLPGDEP